MRRRAPVLTVIVAAIFLLALAAQALKLFEPLPLGTASTSSRLVLDRNGHVLRAFTTPEGRWRLDASPRDVSQTYLDLLLNFEDRRFWSHTGVDPLALGRAILQAVRYGRPVSGGSTLTMQVARLLRGAPTHSIASKFQQIADALRLEASLGKPGILALYLKLAPYGGNLEGVRAASHSYFGKEPARLSIAEAALLVAIPQSPETRRLDRSGSDDVARPMGRVLEPVRPRNLSLLAARNRVIRRGIEGGVLTTADGRAAMAQAAPAGRREFPTLAPHISERLAAAISGGPIITTTIDKALQEAAEKIARRNAESFGEKVSIAALVVKNSTGEVMAHVGSAGYFDSTRLGAIDMTAAIRSPGSALKPFIYGLAFEDGLAHPETLIEDRPVRFDNYAPVNFDNAFHGTVTVRTALQLSLNIPAVKVLNEVGPLKLGARFRDAGIPFDVPRNLTVALGGVGLTLENLATLYTALARGGTVIPLRYRKDGGGLMPEELAESPHLLQPAAAWYVADVMRGAPVPPSATPGMVAFKTGTSYGYRDAWAAGFDGDYTVAVWAGRADASAVPGLVGLRVAAPVLFELFGAIGPKRAPFSGPPRGVMPARRTADLPPPMRAFHEQQHAAIAVAGPEQPLHIAYPPANAEVELAAGSDPDKRLPVALKAEGGTLPLTWLVDGVPLSSQPHRRDAFMVPSGPGFVHVTVVDAAGHSDRSDLRLR